MTDGETIHLLQAQDQLGSKRMSVAKCGEKITHGKTERCDLIVAWWRTVTCPTCKTAGADSVAYWRANNPEPPAKPKPKPKPKTGTEPVTDRTESHPTEQPPAIEPQTAEPALARSEPEAADLSPTPGLENVVEGGDRRFRQTGSTSRWPCPELDDPDYRYVLSRANKMAAETSPGEAIEWAVNYAWGAAALNEATAAEADPSSVGDRLAWSAEPQHAVEAQ